MSLKIRHYSVNFSIQELDLSKFYEIGNTSLFPIKGSHLIHFLSTANYLHVLCSTLLVFIPFIFLFYRQQTPLLQVSFMHHLTCLTEFNNTLCEFEWLIFILIVLHLLVQFCSFKHFSYSSSQIFFCMWFSYSF